MGENQSKEKSADSGDKVPEKTSGKQPQNDSKAKKTPPLLPNGSKTSKKPPLGPKTSTKRNVVESRSPMGVAKPTNHGDRDGSTELKAENGYSSSTKPQPSITTKHKIKAEKPESKDAKSEVVSKDGAAAKPSLKSNASNEHVSHLVDPSVSFQNGQENKQATVQQTLKMDTVTRVQSEVKYGSANLQQTVTSDAKSDIPKKVDKHETIETTVQEQNVLQTIDAKTDKSQNISEPATSQLQITKTSVGSHKSKSAALKRSQDSLLFPVQKKKDSRTGSLSILNEITGHSHDPKYSQVHIPKTDYLSKLQQMKEEYNKTLEEKIKGKQQSKSLKEGELQTTFVQEETKHTSSELPQQCVNDDVFEDTSKVVITADISSAETQESGTDYEEVISKLTSQYAKALREKGNQEQEDNDSYLSQLRKLKKDYNSKLDTGVQNLSAFDSDIKKIPIPDPPTQPTPSILDEPPLLIGPRFSWGAIPSPPIEHDPIQGADAAEHSNYSSFGKRAAQAYQRRSLSDFGSGLRRSGSDVSDGEPPSLRWGTRHRVGDAVPAQAPLVPVKRQYRSVLDEPPIDLHTQPEPPPAVKRTEVGWPTRRIRSASASTSPASPTFVPSPSRTGRFTYEQIDTQSTSVKRGATKDYLASRRATPAIPSTGSPTYPLDQSPMFPVDNSLYSDGPPTVDANHLEPQGLANDVSVSNTTGPLGEATPIENIHGDNHHTLANESIVPQEDNCLALQMPPEIFYVNNKNLDIETNSKVEDIFIVEEEDQTTRL